MSNPTYFVQECPTCGRGVQIRVEYLGRKVVCRHCQGQLIAMDPANARRNSGDSGNALIRRADALLNSIARERIQSRQCPR